MNAEAVLALVGDLYAQLASANAEIEQLRAQLVMGGPLTDEQRE